MHVMCVRKQRNGNCFCRGCTRHRSASLIYSWDPVTWKRKLSRWIRKVICLKSFCCFCLTFLWGMGMDCSVKLSNIGVFQHENKSLGTSGFVQIHFSISRHSWSLSETRTCILSSCMTPKLLMLLYGGSRCPLAQSVCDCQCLSCSWNGWAQFHLVLWNTRAVVTTLELLLSQCNHVQSLSDAQNLLLRQSTREPVNWPCLLSSPCSLGRCVQTPDCNVPVALLSQWLQYLKGHLVKPGLFMQQCQCSHSWCRAVLLVLIPHLCGLPGAGISSVSVLAGQCSCSLPCPAPALALLHRHYTLPALPPVVFELFVPFQFSEAWLQLIHTLVL